MAKAATKATVKVKSREGVTDARRLAEVVADPTVTGGFLTSTFSKGVMGETDLTELLVVIREAADKAASGDLRELEAMLAAQAAALNVMFGELARRGAANMGEYMDATERYLRLGLKAQAQCRATVETLATIKNPSVVIARQANIAAGPQQVNNGTDTRGRGRAGARAERSETLPNELLEVNGGAGERLDGGAAGAAVGGDPALATVGALDGSAND